MSMTHIHSDDCCVNMQYKDLGDKAPPPFTMWKYYLDQMIEAISEKHFTGQANFYYDDDAKDPMILVIVAAQTQEEMEEKFQQFMQARAKVLPSILSSGADHDGADDDEPESDEAGVNTEAVNDLAKQDSPAHSR